MFIRKIFQYIYIKICINNRLFFYSVIFTLKMEFSVLSWISRAQVLTVIRHSRCNINRKEKKIRFLNNIQFTQEIQPFLLRAQFPSTLCQVASAVFWWEWVISPLVPMVTPSFWTKNHNYCYYSLGSFQLSIIISVLVRFATSL